MPPDKPKTPSARRGPNAIQQKELPHRLLDFSDLWSVDLFRTMEKGYGVYGPAFDLY